MYNNKNINNNSSVNANTANFDLISVNNSVNANTANFDYININSSIKYPDYNSLNTLSSNIFYSTTANINDLYASSVYANRFIENAVSVSFNSWSSPYVPYTLDYSKGSLFYIPFDKTTVNAARYSIITNFPLDKTKTYSLSMFSYNTQVTNQSRCTSLQIIDICGNYVFGSSGNVGVPLVNGGNYTLTSQGNFSIQQFNVFFLPWSAGSISGPITYVTSTVSYCY